VHVHVCARARAVDRDMMYVHVHVHSVWRGGGVGARRVDLVWCGVTPYVAHTRGRASGPSPLPPSPTYDGALTMGFY
jgi:hypothetical protein